jgi:hypothetical protein
MHAGIRNAKLLRQSGYALTLSIAAFDLLIALGLGDMFVVFGFSGSDWLCKVQQPQNNRLGYF